MNWEIINDGSYSIDSSSMQDGNCPKCNRPITKSHLTKTDKDSSGEDVYGWHYYHPCGAKLLVTNE